METRERKDPEGKRSSGPGLGPGKGLRAGQPPCGLGFLMKKQGVGRDGEEGKENLKKKGN